MCGHVTDKAAILRTALKVRKYKIKRAGFFVLRLGEDFYFLGRSGGEVV